MKAWTLRATVAACMLVAASAAHSALVNPFKVNENVIQGSGAPPAPVSMKTADRLSGTYVERFQVTGANTFATAAIFEAGSLVAGGPQLSGVLLNADPLFTTFGYRLYSVFTATGTFTSSGGDLQFTGTSADFSLYADPNSNSNDAATGVRFTNLVTDLVAPLAITGMELAGAEPDVLLARSNLLMAGAGSFNPVGVNKGDFAIIFSGLAQTSDGTSNGLTALGKQYFFDPSPFYDGVRISGQFDSFTLPTLNMTTEFLGSADITFIPEPGSLALAGLALSALGLSLRRRKV